MGTAVTSFPSQAQFQQTGTDVIWIASPREPLNYSGQNIIVHLVPFLEPLAFSDQINAAGSFALTPLYE